MKKLFVFLTLALVSFFITGCIDENTDPKASVENAISQCFKNVMSLLIKMLFLMRELLEGNKLM